MAQNVNIDYGQADIAAFKQQAVAAAQSGHFLFDPQVVDEVVRVYDVLIEGLQNEMKNIQSIAYIGGFGGFPSTQQLAQGFSKKANEFAAVLAHFIEGAMRLQEAYLISAGKITEAEAKNTQALQIIAQTVGTENSAR
ncbi:hypothetical protein [Nocardia transvalensis]|uniref:hypothetical protein n=1 Tax=Nocardia transvalensis TaxID=37333 RepID=UPI0018939CF3|nr:hypothetical protein [Nocardia transvalensis]MBF6332340.1 hypothetical protein [Nocardia transvalensis]